MNNKKLFFGLLILYFLVQLVYVAFFSLPFESDSWNYYKLALSAIDESTYYPSPDSKYFAWIVAPVYINYLIVLLHIKVGPDIIIYFNILLNFLQLSLVFLVTRRLFDDKSAIIASTVYIFYLNNLGQVLLNHTELIFGILLLLSIYLYLDKNSVWNFIFCGFITGLALGVRPTAYALILAYIILYVYKLFFREYEHRKLVFLFLGIILYIIPMGILSKKNIGYFTYTSTTGPANLIMSANENAKGIYDDYIFKHDSILLSKKTFKEKDDYLMKRSVAYIKEHPGKFLGLIPKKIYSTFISDGWALGEVLHSQEWDLNNYIKAYRTNNLGKFREQPIFFQISFYVINIFHQLLYSCIVLLFLYQLYTCLRYHNKIRKNILLMYIFIIIGVGMSIISSVGNPRYKYNFLIISIILVAPLIESVLKSKLSKNKNVRIFSINHDKTS